MKKHVLTIAYCLGLIIVLFWIKYHISHTEKTKPSNITHVFIFGEDSFYVTGAIGMQLKINIQTAIHWNKVNGDTDYIDIIGLKPGLKPTLYRNNTVVIDTTATQLHSYFPIIDTVENCTIHLRK